MAELATLLVRPFVALVLFVLTVPGACLGVVPEAHRDASNLQTLTTDLEGQHIIGLRQKLAGYEKARRLLVTGLVWHTDSHERVLQLARKCSARITIDFVRCYRKKFHLGLDPVP
jgi:hypothetical protein